MDALQKTVATYKAREVELIRVTNSQSEIVGNAEIARDQALAREQSAKEIISKLNERVRLEVEGAKRNADEQIARVFQQSKERELKLQDELKRLELLCHELEQQREKANRDKISAINQFQK